MAIPKSIVFLTLTTGVLAALSACSEPPKNPAHGPNDFQVGRFRIVTVPSTGDVIEIDTANGKTWVLRRNDLEDGGGIVGWGQIDDLP